MALLSKNKQLVAARLEAVPGTPNAPSVATSGTLTDTIPMLREASHSLEPIRFERNTLRTTQTPLPDIYSGKGLVTLEFTVEMTSNPTFTGLSPTGANGQVVSTMQPAYTKLLQACGMVSFTPATSVSGVFTGRRVRAWRLGALTGGAFVNNGPLRHGEDLQETPDDAGMTAASAFGDTYNDDGILYVLEGGVLGATTVTSFASTRSAANTVFNIHGTAQRSALECFAMMPWSDLNTQMPITIDLYKDGKALRIKGAMGTCEFIFKHGEACLMHFTFQGVYVQYSDATFPVAAVDPHKYPPTFLGPRLTMRRSINSPAASEQYGTDGGGSGIITGALNEMTLELGSDVILRENSIDPNGVNFAVMKGRAPSGKFNPDEVLNSEFNLMNFFTGGTPLRGRTIVSGPPPTGGAFVYDQPQTQIYNTFDFFMPGMVFSDLVDGDRDSIQAWDGSFGLKGGDYDSTAQGENVGSDNEFLLVHR